MECINYEPLYSNFGHDLKFKFNPSGGFEIGHEPIRTPPDYFSLDRDQLLQTVLRLHKKNRSLEAIIECQKEIVQNIQRETDENAKRKVEAEKSYYRKYFSTCVRNTQQKIVCARREALLAVFDGIIEGLNGILFPKYNNISRQRRSPKSFGDMGRYRWKGVEDVIGPKEDRSLAEKKAIKAFLNDILPPDLIALARAVYSEKMLIERKFGPIPMLPQVCQNHAVELITTSKLKDDIKNTATWYIRTSPETDVGGCIFEEDTQSDTTDLQRLQEEASEFRREAARLGISGL